MTKQEQIQECEDIIKESRIVITRYTSVIKAMEEQIELLKLSDDSREYKC